MNRPRGRVAIFSAILILLFSCNSGSKDPWTYVTMPAGTALFKLNQSSANLVFGADSASARQLPIRAFDVLAFPDDRHRRVIRYRDQMPDTLSFGGQDSLITLNGSCYEVNIAEEMDVQALKQHLTELDIRNLKHLYIEGKLLDNQLPLLEAIAAVNPGVDLELYVGKDALDSGQVSWISKRFKPSFMMLDCSANDMSLIASFQTLENLVLFIDQDDELQNVQPIPALPKLRALTISINTDSLLPAGFLSMNPQIRNLDLYAEKLDIPEIAGHTPQLERLYLRTRTQIQQLPYGKYWPSLRTLYLHAPLDSRFNFLMFNQEPDLLELGIGQDIDQLQFDSIIIGQPKLQWLEIQQPDTLLIDHYEILSKLPHLRSLLISEKIGEVEALEKLTKLEFLSVPILNASDSAKWKSLESSLPNTRITPNTGYCMGSGWILMIWPVLLITLFIHRIQKQKQQMHEI